MNSTSSISEGKAVVSLVGVDTNVFYNPVQEFNRDLSILVLRQFASCWRETRSQKSSTSCASTSQVDSSFDGAKRVRLEVKTCKDHGLNILEGLSASGLRAIRYAKEVPGIRKIIANDFSDQAVQCIRRNIDMNNVGHVVEASRNDVITIMHEHKFINKRFDVVDLDPYGSPAHFLDAAVQAVTDDGLLMVTCTDMATLCGNTPEACFAKYGSMSLKSKCCHELALRILIRSIDTHANRYGRYVEPLLSVHVDFYIRVFLRLHSGAAKAKDSCCKSAYVYQCCSCESLYLQSLARKSTTEKGGIKYQNAFGPITPQKCEHCYSKFHLGGPIWSGPLHNSDFVRQMLDLMRSAGDEERLGTQKRIYGLLSVISEELNDVPLFYNISRLSNITRCPAPPLLSIRSAILNSGFRVSPSHIDPQAIKTDAPCHVIWDLYRCWARQCGVKLNAMEPSSASYVILSQEPKLVADFKENAQAESLSRKEGFMRFQPKLVKNWGPKSKARGSISSVNAGYFSTKDHDAINSETQLNAAQVGP